MKIEIGESLLVSWLRHVKECQIVQTNWKASMKWELKNRDTLKALMQSSEKLFSDTYGYKIYKSTTSFEQLIKQAEIDVIGIAFGDDQYEIYAIDVAFHEAGLSYGSREETVGRVIKKCLRTAMCIYGYYGLIDGTIIFTTPKMNPAIVGDIKACMDNMHAVLKQVGLNYEIRIIANEDFSEKILEPVLSVLGDVADTGELFMRSLQLHQMFALKKPERVKPIKTSAALPATIEGSIIGLEEMKVGAIARKVLGQLLEEGQYVSVVEIEKLQTAEYSRQVFHLSYPLLQKAASSFDKVRYYALPLHIFGEDYFLCSQWLETHRPHLLNWLASHKA